MKFFIDTAELKDIEELSLSGLVDGVTTNPSLVAKSGKNFIALIKEIAKIIPGPVSAEVASLEYDQMLEEALFLAKIASNIAVKVPLTPAGLRVCKHLTDREHMVNVTLCFSAAQALLAAKAGATFISPFIGRLDDIGQDGLGLISEIAEIYSQYPEFNTQILAASIRTPLHVIESAKMGADVATIPPQILRQLFAHPLTDKGIAQFTADWQSTGQKILSA